MGIAMTHLFQTCVHHARYITLLAMGAWLAAAAHMAMAAASLEVGVLPNVSARVLMTQYEPMQSHLHKQLGLPVLVSTAPSWREFYQRLKQGQYQLVVVAGNVARLAEKDLGYKPLVSYEPLVPAVFVTKKGVSTQPSVLMNGQKLALGNPASLVAFEGARWLDQQGLQSGKHYQTLQVRADDSVGSAIIRGEAAAGIMSMGEFRAHAPEVREQLSIHTRFAEVTSFVVMASPTLDAAMAERVRKLLLAFDGQVDDGRLFFERSGFKAIVPFNPSALQQLDAYVDSTRKLLD